MGCKEPCNDKEERRKRRRLAKCSLLGDPTLSLDCACSGVYQIYQCRATGGHCVRVGHDKHKGRIVETGEVVYTKDVPVCGTCCKNYSPVEPE